MQVKQVNQMIQKILVSLMALLALMVVPLGTMQPVQASSYGTVQLSPSYTTTYAASSALVTPATSATDLAIINGSASKTIKVLKVFLTYRTTPVGAVDSSPFYLIKRSTANSGGTSSGLTPVALDSGNAAASVANPLIYTANPTTGSTVGTVQMAVASAGTVAGGSVILYDADKYGQAVVLRGTAQGLAVNSNGVTVAGTSPLVSVTFVWTEE